MLFIITNKIIAHLLIPGFILSNIYLPVFMVLVYACLFIGLLYLLSYWASEKPFVPRSRPVFLSGLLPQQHAMSRYHVRWYLVGLLFLAFDMEMVFMYPWAVVFADIGWMAMVEMGAFLLILLLGVLYAWRERALRWT